MIHFYGKLMFLNMSLLINLTMDFPLIQIGLALGQISFHQMRFLFHYQTMTMTKCMLKNH